MLTFCKTVQALQVFAQMLTFCKTVQAWQVFAQMLTFCKTVQALQVFGLFDMGINLTEFESQTGSSHTKSVDHKHFGL